MGVGDGHQLGTERGENSFDDAANLLRVLQRAWRMECHTCFHASSFSDSVLIEEARNSERSHVIDTTRAAFFA